jgi:hypothetical protein
LLYPRYFNAIKKKKKGAQVEEKRVFHVCMCVCSQQLSSTKSRRMRKLIEYFIERDRERY